MKKRMLELMTCAIEQGYFIKLGRKKYIDFLVFLILKEIEEKKWMQ